MDRRGKQQGTQLGNGARDQCCPVGPIRRWRAGEDGGRWRHTWPGPCEEDGGDCGRTWPLPDASYCTDTVKFVGFEDCGRASLTIQISSSCIYNLQSISWFIYILPFSIIKRWVSAAHKPADVVLLCEKNTVP